MTEFSQWYGLTGVPVVTQIVEALKEAGLPKKWAPVVSLVVGVILNLALAIILGKASVEAIAVGLVTGIAASGYYDVKSAIKS